MFVAVPIPCPDCKSRELYRLPDATDWLVACFACFRVYLMWARMTQHGYSITMIYRSQRVVDVDASKGTYRLVDETDYDGPWAT